MVARESSSVWCKLYFILYVANLCKRIRLVLGLEDGIEHSDEEVAKEANVCVNRIQKHKATFLRIFKRLPCTIKLEELLKG